MTTINIHGRHLQVTQALQEYVERKIGTVQAWFEEPVTIQVTLSIQGNKHEHTVEVTIAHHGMVFRAEVRDSDMYAAIDVAADKLDRTLRKYKERARRKLRVQSRALVGSVQDNRSPQADPEEHEEFDVMKTKRIVLKPVDIQEAILQMNMSDHSFYLFHNRDSSRLEVVYRRKDGTYGHLQEG